MSPAPRRSGRRFNAFALLAYLAVIAALLALALFGRGSTVRLADARLGVRYAPVPLFGRVVDRATLSYRGLRLSFGRAFPIAGSDGAASAIRELRTHGEGIDLVYGDGLRLALREADDGGFSLALARDPGAPADTLSLTIPVRVPGGLRPDGDEPALAWRRAGRSYWLSLPPGSRIDADARALVLDAGSRELQFGPADAGGEDLAARWLAEQAALVDEAALRAAADAFADAAWDGWTRTRLSADRAQWRGADGRFAFREDAAAGLLAESLVRGDYPARRVLAAAALERALRAAPGTVTSAAVSAFTGNLREHARRVRAAEAPGLERIRALLAERDPALFLEHGLVPFLLDHGPFSLVQEVVTLAGALRAGPLAPAAALGVLEAYLDYDEFAAGDASMAASAREVVRARLVPFLEQAGPGLYLRDGAGAVDTAISIRCGATLVRAAAALGDASLAAIGRSLVASGLALRDDEGFLPGTLQVSAGAARPVPGVVAVPPEAVYPFAFPDRRLPREVPLHRAVGPGAWLWTAAGIVEIAGDATGLRLQIAFPAGQPHYLLLDGLRSVASVTLHGTAWRPAADYAQYSDGWAWDAAEGQLFIKLTGKADTETIAITY